jgi:hypothetical protein
MSHDESQSPSHRNGRRSNDVPFYESMHVCFLIMLTYIRCCSKISQISKKTAQESLGCTLSLALKAELRSTLPFRIALSSSLERSLVTSTYVQSRNLKSRERRNSSLCLENTAGGKTSNLAEKLFLALGTLRTVLIILRWQKTTLRSKYLACL